MNWIPNMETLFTFRMSVGLVALPLKRSRDLRGKIKNFMREKGQDVTFFDGNRILNDLASLADITQPLSDLKLQGKN